jgi:non-ribosomal peptide synthetase component E (peptide arylation enzyme)
MRPKWTRRSGLPNGPRSAGRRGLRIGLMMAAERKAYHARVLERRAHELGAELRSIGTEQGSRLVELLANREIADVEKLLALTALIQDPQTAVAPLMAFAAALNSDVETKQALRLLAEDELSSATWLRDVCASLSSGQGPSSKNPGSGGLESSGGNLG